MADITELIDAQSDQGEEHAISAEEKEYCGSFSSAHRTYTLYTYSRQPSAMPLSTRVNIKCAKTYQRPGKLPFTRDDGPLETRCLKDLPAINTKKTEDEVCEDGCSVFINTNQDTKNNAGAY